eukprot:COSAG02_NODE_8360_length_2598_cov_3.812725_1_plen_44_part_10
MTLWQLVALRLTSNASAAALAAVFDSSAAVLEITADPSDSPAAA